jgi:glycosyltransferase involved in cell wall biosynthesis
MPGGAALAEALGGLPDGAWVVIDGLATAEAPEVVAAHRSRLRIVALVHQVRGDSPGLDAARRDQLHALERDALTAAHGVIVTSAFTAIRLAVIGVDPSRIRTVTPGTDRATLAVGPGPGRPPQILCVGAVTFGKGQDVLVAALESLVAIPWTCLLVGDVRPSNGYVAQLTAKIEETGLSGRIEMVGSVDGDALEAFYRGSSVFVLPTRYEAYGMALTEAMARGLPVVTTSAGAIPETVPSDAAIRVPPGDEVALAAALRPLLADGPEDRSSAARRRASLGVAGLRHASTLPTWDQSVERFAASVAALGG